MWWSLLGVVALGAGCDERGLRELRRGRDQMCACTDARCVDAVLASLRMRRVRDVAAAELIGRELLACAERALTAPAGAAWPGPPASAARSR